MKARSAPWKQGPSWLLLVVLLVVFSAPWAALAEDRQAERPPTVIMAPPPSADATETQLLAALCQARRAGDRALAASIEEELAHHLGQTPARGAESLTPFADTADPADAVTVVCGQPSDAPVAGRWLPDDIAIADTEEFEGNSVLASDSQGHLFAGFGSSAGAGSVWLMRSPDGGAHWYLWLGIFGEPATDLSIAVGEGAGDDWLLMAYSFEDDYEDFLRVTRITLDYPVEYEHTVIAANAEDIRNPKIVTDCSEYAAWYGYLIYNTLEEYNWQIHMTRTRDGGDSWGAPTVVAGYCGVIGDFYDARYRPPALAYGGDNLYVAYENYPAPCEGPDRDIFVIVSDNFGLTWRLSANVTQDADDEYAPAVAAVKGETAQPTAVVAYTRYYADLDLDIWYVRTQDDAASWSADHCLACTVTDEQSVNVITSASRGYIHAAFCRTPVGVAFGHIDYAVAEYTNPGSWDRYYAVNDGGEAVNWDPPGLLDSLVGPASHRVGISWTDSRDYVATRYDVYFDHETLTPTPVDEPAVSGGLETPLLICPSPLPDYGVVRYRLPRAARVQLGIYDLRGRCVRRLISGAVSEAGDHPVVWDGRDDGGRHLPSGVYCVRLAADAATTTAKVLIVR